MTTSMMILAGSIIAFGFFFMILCYYTSFFTKSSGGPFLGGLLVAIGFLLTPYKWFALLGLLDMGFWSLPYAIVGDRNRYKKYVERFEPFFEEKGYREREAFESKCLVIKVKELDEELEHAYITRCSYFLYYPKVDLAICINKDGERFLVTYEYQKDSQIKVYPFKEDTISLPPLKSRGRDMHVELEIRDAEEGEFRKVVDAVMNNNENK